MSLEFFYVGIDLLSNYKELPDSANLQFLYIAFKALDAINYSLPLSAVFSMIITKFAMIRSNELVTLYAIGISKREVIKPLFLTSLFISSIYIALNFTSFSYALEYSRNLLKYNTISKDSENLFFKSGKNYIYFDKLHPVKKQANGIKIFNIKDNDLEKIIIAKYAYFNKDSWTLYDVTTKIKPKVSSITDKGITEYHQDKLVTLANFRPKVVENIFKGEYNMSIIDTIDALNFFSSQDVNLDRIKTLLYSHILFPLFMPFLIVILFYNLPISARFFNLTLTSFLFIFASLVVWGILFILTKLAASSVIIPEIGVIAPILILALISSKYYYSNQ